MLVVVVCCAVAFVIVRLHTPISFAYFKAKDKPVLPWCPDRASKTTDAHQQTTDGNRSVVSWDETIGQSLGIVSQCNQNYAWEVQHAYWGRQGQGMHPVQVVAMTAEAVCRSFSYYTHSIYRS